MEVPRASLRRIRKPLRRADAPCHRDSAQLSGERRDNPRLYLQAAPLRTPERRRSGATITGR